MTKQTATFAENTATLLLMDKDLTTQIRDIISTEIQRRPVVHLTINLPLDTTTNPEHLANTILKVLQGFQCLPPSPPVSEGSDKPQ